MKLADELRGILSDSLRKSREEERLSTDELVDLLKSEEFSRKDAGLVARTLVERFFEIDEASASTFLPRVGETIGTIRDAQGNPRVISVTKVEKRTDKNQNDFWVVGLDFGGRGFKSKTIFLRGQGKFKVSWKVGRSKFLSKIVSGSQLKTELARNVFNL